MSTWQFRVTPHCHADDNTSLFWQGGTTEGKVKVGGRGRAVRRGSRSDVPADCWTGAAGWRCCRVCWWTASTPLVAVTQPHVRPRDAAPRHLRSRPVFTVTCLLFFIWSVSSQPVRRAFAYVRVETSKEEIRPKMFARTISGRQAALTWVVDSSIIWAAGNLAVTALIIDSSIVIYLSCWFKFVKRVDLLPCFKLNVCN